MKRSGRLRQGLRRLLQPVRLGVLRRTRPLSDAWGFDRGTPVDRYYIEGFLAAHREDVRGRVLEVQDSGYTDRFGTGVLRRDVLDVDASNPRATIVADLAAADGIPEGAFDCFILTQTLHLIYDFRAALGHAHRLLRPGGVLLATLPAVSRVSRGAAASDCWRFTPVAASALFGEVFGPERVTVRAYGNVLTAVAFLSGMAREELSRRDLEARDESFPVIVAVRAVKA
ncbi:MAG TPA: methyltransferase domain-containing protein [Thermoanaerobaculia bacterium]|nr:methyltransferase domain-containing protein [Thermoanaerobaculia bacterium]